MTQPTAQDLWFDAMIRHQIGLLRRAGAIRTRVFLLLDATESDLRQAIRDRLRKHTGTDTPANVLRMRKLLDEIREIRSTAWRDVDRVWLSAMAEIAIAEPAFVAGLLETVVPVQLKPTLPTAAQMRALVTEKPFEGRLMREWASEVRATDIRRIHDQIRMGLVQGEDVPTISRRVTGTVSLKGRNGVTQITRNNAEAITRTAANHFANQARREFFKLNADVLDDELFVATLDSRTTAICRSLDGERFDVGVGPIPPLHWSCRSVRTAILDEEAIGDRPMKPTTERQLLREFAAREKLAKVPRERDALPRGTKGAFDSFARDRVREMTGIVPAKTSYQQFLERQPAWFQDDVLGKTRGKLFRAGGLPLTRFVDRATGAEFTLAELAKVHARAFEAAGLDPEAFLARARR